MKTFEAWYNFKKKDKNDTTNSEPEVIDPYGEEDWNDVDEVVKAHLYKRVASEERKKQTNGKYYTNVSDILLLDDNGIFYLVGDIRYSRGDHFMTYYYYPRGTKRVTVVENEIEPLTDDEYTHFRKYLEEKDYIGDLRIDINRDVTYLDIVYNKIKTI